MLFDLRSRRRRNAVRVIYAFLALLMLSGLILVGVGTGNDNGGLLNAFTDSGSGSSDTDNAYASQVKSALKSTAKNPNDASAWESLMQARLGEAQSGSKNYDSTTETYTASGKAVLQQSLTAWNKYLKLVAGKPTYTAALLADRVYAGLDDYLGQAGAWQYVITGQGSSASAGDYTCLAYTAYAGGDKSLGDLAATKAVKLTASLDRLTLKDSLKSAKSSTTTAKDYILENNC